MKIPSPPYGLLPKAIATMLVVLIVVNAALAFDDTSCCGCCQPPPGVISWQAEVGGGCCADLPLCGWSAAPAEPALPAVPPPVSADAQPLATVAATGFEALCPEAPLAGPPLGPVRHGPPIFALTCILLI